MISVVIPLYNKSANIVSTVDSVITQNYRDFELIIVNDGSTDDSLEIAKSINDKRIRIIDKKNGGVSSARNTGILAANFEYIAFLDGDDFWFPNHLEVIVAMIEKYSGDAVGFVTRFIKSKSFIDSNTISQYEPINSYIINDYFKEVYKPYSILSSSNFAINKSIAITVGLYDESLKYGEDVEFWDKIFLKNGLAVSNELTAVYNIGALNRSDVKIIPLKHRYHNFNFDNADKNERKYLGKLVCIIIMDYSMQRAYSIAFKVYWRYRKYSFFILGYFLSLVKKKLKK